MEPFRQLCRWAALGGMVLSATAYAQKEQWLEYHTSREERGYRSLSLSTNPPPNVALPKCAAQPYFARWTSPLDSTGGRWICFDRTRKAGPYDRVYIDANGNGRLDDEAPVGTFRLDQYSAYFESAKVVFKGEDGPISYHLVFRFTKYDDGEVRAVASSGGYYAGQVEFDGKKRRLELVDYNVNGTFNDHKANAYESDCLTVEKDPVSQRYLGKLLEVDGQFYQIEVARDGAFVKLQKGEVTLGQVRVPETISEFIAFGENGHFVRKPAKGEFSLPAGSYRILEWTINRKDAGGASWQLVGSDVPEATVLEVVADKPARLEIGEPVDVSLSKQERTNQVVFNLSFQGPLKESIQFRKNQQNPPGPKLLLASQDGTYRSTNTFEFG